VTNPIGTAIPTAAPVNEYESKRPQTPGTFYTLMPMTTNDFVVRQFTDGNLLPIVGDSSPLPHITNQNADNLKYEKLDIFRVRHPTPNRLNKMK
jgi:hypothetical protein